MMMVTVVIAPFFEAIIIATWQVVRSSRLGNLVDSSEQISVVDLPPFIAGKWTTRCRRGQRRCWCGWSHSQCGWSCSWHQWRSDQRRSDLHLIHGRGGEADEAGGLGDLADGEIEAVRHDHEVRDDDHLARLESYTHTPHLAHHYRRNMVSSLPGGMPRVVDCR